MLALESYWCIWVTLTCKREWVNTNIKDILFHLPNEGLEDLKSLALVFLYAYKQGFLFLHIWSIASGQL